MSRVGAEVSPLDSPPAAPDQKGTMGVEPNEGLSFAVSSADFFERDGLGTALLLLSRFDSVKQLDENVDAVRSQRRFDFRQFVTPMGRKS